MSFLKLSKTYGRGYGRLGIYVINLLIFICSGILAFLLRYEFTLTDLAWNYTAWAISLWIIVKSGVFHYFGLDRGGWRYVSTPDVVRLSLGNLVGSLLALPLIMFLAPSGFPRSIYVLDLFLCTFGTAGARITARLIWNSAGRPAVRAKPIVIYGAGNAGVILLSEIRNNPRLGYDVRGFVDDDREKLGQIIQRVPVLGGGPDLPAIAAKQNLEEVLIAMPSASSACMTAILRNCHNAGLHCRTIPSLAEVIEHQALTPQIRDVAVEDLLGRTPVRLDERALREKLENKVVMVTGAGGSIGSELCRQIARFRPRAIIGYEIAETPLFDIDREMRKLFPDVEFRPEIGSIQNRSRLDEVLECYRPSVLYHAAAYKHVPLMESHLFEAVENNVLGTENVALAAAEHGVTDFVMISSDKAVRPTNVMGATKRMAELLVHALQNGRAETRDTKYVSVRFGNVLGSNGSVVPLFKKQIASGGPITITHPEMKRYFMTIPEAAQLVLQASTMSKGGEIFVLDMGAQVRIVDLATNLILLSGLRPQQDIQLLFTGIRPGEKLYEELSGGDENTLPTFHEKIMIYSGPVLAYEEMQTRLNAIRRYCAERNVQKLFLEMKKAVPEYNPSGDILHRLLAPEPVMQLSVPISATLAHEARA
jgi:FlaA1/EpsC-like NDP-sugar epimerase